MEGELAEALLDAVKNRDAGIVAHLLGTGADPQGVDADGVPLLLYAADSGDLAVVRPFLEAGAPVDLATDDGMTALMSAAAAEDSLELVEFLIAAGSDVNARYDVDDDAHTVLTWALDTPTEPVIRALLAAGADPNVARGDGFTPLMLAAQDQPISTVRLLLDAGADPSAAKGETVTAVSIAERWERPDVVDLLCAHGAADPEDVALTRVQSLWEEVGAWLAGHAPGPAADLHTATGADNTLLNAVETETCLRLPTDIRAHFRLYGGGGSSFFEYDGLGVEAALRRWRSLGEQQENGTFDEWAPRELAVEENRIEPMWWNPGWLPFAEDGGGNLYCVDLTPGPQGARGQVISWEVHAGPVGPLADSFLAYLTRYRDELRSGRYRYDMEAGTFDDAE